MASLLSFKHWEPVLVWMFCVVSLGTQTGCGATGTHDELRSVYFENGEIACVVKRVRFSVQKEFGIEGTKEREKPVGQEIWLWKGGVNKPLQKRQVASFSSPPQHEVDPISGADVMVHSVWRGVRVGFKEFRIFDPKRGVDVSELFGTNVWATAFSRSRQKVLLARQNEVVVAESSTLTKEEPVFQPRRGWEDFFQIKREYFHHASLTDDGKYLICFPEGMVGANQVFVFGLAGKRVLPLPRGLRWNDLIDAESIDGKLFFVTRNFGSAGDSYQITDDSWRIVHSLPPPGRGYIRPVWDLEKSRLVFPPFAPELDSVKTLNFFAWNYETGVTNVIQMNVENKN